MPKKTTTEGREYEVDGRKFLWFPLDDDDKPAIKGVALPMRIKLKVLRSIGDKTDGTDGMFKMLEQLAPKESIKVFDEMDVNDFQDMFVTWQDEYNSLTGGSLGESSPSAGSSPSTEQPSSTTSEVVSTVSA